MSHSYERQHGEIESSTRWLPNPIHESAEDRHAKTFRLTRLLALSGETHAGRSFAASMSRNSPSVSRMLLNCQRLASGHGHKQSRSGRSGRSG